MRADDGRVVSNVVTQALSGSDISIYGDGSQTRSFCYLDDLVSGLLALGFHSSPVRTPVNLGNPTEITVSELAQTVLQLTGSPSRIVYTSLPVDDPRRRKPDISLAKELLEWAPKVPLRKGLGKTIEWFASTRHEWDRVNSLIPAMGIRGLNGAGEEAAL